MENSTVQDQYRAKKRFWQTHMRAWKKSGLSQNEYCRRNKLRPNQFCYWKKKLIGSNKDTSKFVPVIVPTHKVDKHHNLGDSGLTISFDKISIKLKNDFNPSALVKVVTVLGGIL